jgi:hypothetical protein
MKTYSKSNVSNDPSRFLWSNNHSNTDKVNHNNTVLERDIFLKDSISNSNNNVQYNRRYPPVFVKPQINTLFSKNDLSYEPREPSKPMITPEQFNDASNFLHKKPIDSITSSSNDRQRYQTMINEVMVKDKEIQKFKVLNEQLKGQIANLEKERINFQSNENELEILQRKLSKEIEINKEMTDVKLKYNKLLSVLQEQEETIKSLKQIIHKYNTMVTEKTVTSYTNKQLQETLPKFYEGMPKEAIEHILQQFKITEDTDITEELLRSIDTYINESMIEK